MALALARPEGAAAGADGLALFYLEPRDAESRWQSIRVDRLKREARHARTADSGNPSRRRARDTSSAKRATACARSRRCSMSRARGTQCARWRRCAVRSRWRTTMRNAATCSAGPDRATAAPRHAGRHRGAIPGGVPSVFHAVELLGRAEHGMRQRDAAERAAPAHAAGQIVDRKARGRRRLGSLRKLRRRRLPRGQRDAAAAARRAGLPDLGRHDERARAGFPARAARSGGPQALLDAQARSQRRWPRRSRPASTPRAPAARNAAALLESLSANARRPRGARARHRVCLRRGHARSRC